MNGKINKQMAGRQLGRRRGERSEDDKRSRQQHQSRSEETRLGNNIKALN